MKKEVEVTGTIKITDKLDIIELLVRQVSALVATTAHVVETNSKDAFAIEAWLYRNVEVNCLCLSETYALKYWWCSPPRTGIASGRPTVWTARGTGASLCSDRCVRASL